MRTKVRRVYRNIQEIAGEFERARAHVHDQYYHSMRDNDAAEELEERSNGLDYLQAHELSRFITTKKAIESRRRELRAA